MLATNHDYTLASISYMFMKLVIAAFLGAVVGYEREVHERPAGLRTHVLVSMGSTLMTLISLSFAGSGMDPSRIAAQIVSGIGFLGAGTILRQGSVIRGLTTAASLWTVAGIGMAVAMGGIYISLATFTTFIVFITLSQLRRFEPAMGKRLSYSICLQYPFDKPEVLGRVLQTFADMKIQVENISSSRTTAVSCDVQLAIALPHTVTADQVIKMLSSIEGLDQFELA